MGKYIRAVIVEDEEHSRVVINDMIQEHFPEVKILAEADDVENGIETIETYRPDLLLLDINLGGRTSFDILDGLEEKDFDVIFITGESDYAVKAFKASAIDYLPKPLNLDDLQIAIDRYKERKRQNMVDNRINVLLANGKTEDIKEKKLILPLPEGYMAIKVSKITRCESDGNYTTFHLNDGSKELVAKPIGSFEDILEPFRFCRIQRSAIINVNYIAKYVKGRGGQVIMEDGIELDVSRGRKEVFLKMFLNE